MGKKVEEDEDEDEDEEQNPDELSAQVCLCDIEGGLKGTVARGLSDEHLASSKANSQFKQTQRREGKEEASILEPDLDLVLELEL